MEFPRFDPVHMTDPGGTFEYAGQGQKERTKKNSALFLDSVLGVSAEKPGSDYRGYVRDNSGALVGTRVPEGSGSVGLNSPA